MSDIQLLKSQLRSLVVSSPTAVDARTLLRDYRALVGEALPIARHGYWDPVQFLRERCGDCFLFQGPSCNPVLTPIVPDQLRHIDEFVQKQRMPSTNRRIMSISACVCALDTLSVKRAADGEWIGAHGAHSLAPPALRVRRLEPASSRGSLASLQPVDPDEALPGIDYDPDVFPADCLSFVESIPSASVADVVPGAMLPLVVGEVYSPSHLWILRLGDDYEKMEDIMDEMTEYYTKGAGAERVLAAGARRPGQYCSGVYDGDWHRSLIVQLVDTDTVKVRHVDYGTVDTVAARSLRPLRREWGALPAMAVRARLAGVRPPAAGRLWPLPAAQHCLRLVRDKRLVGNVVAVDHEEGILELFLIDTSTAEDVNISDEMVRAGHADPRCLPALGASETYLHPLFSALESGATPNYAEIHALMRDGIALEYVEAYRRHVPALLPPAEPAVPAAPRAAAPRVAPARSQPLVNRAPLPWASPAPPAPPAPPPLPPPPAPAPPHGVTLTASEYEIFQLLSQVDKNAAHRYVSEALRRALQAPAGAAGGPGGAPCSPASLNPLAAKFRVATGTQTPMRPPPGFEHAHPHPHPPRR